MAKPIVQGILMGAIFLAGVGALLFGCAGRSDLPMFWVYLGVYLVAMVVGMFVVDHP